MPATTLILTPNLEQGEPSRASRIAAGMKQKVLGGRSTTLARETVATDGKLNKDGVENGGATDDDETLSSEQTHTTKAIRAEKNADRNGLEGELDRRAIHRDPSYTQTAHSASAGPRTGWSDVELVQAFQLGDEKAFAELYTRRKREIYTFCVRMLGGDRDLASDAFQETFIKVYEKGQSFRSGANVMGWLFMIARNTCLNLHRSKRPSEALDDQRMLVSSDRSLGPEYGEEQHHLRELLEQAIAILPDEFREPFILREFDGFAYGEIAKMIGVSLPTTKVRIYRAKQRLRELLKPYLESAETDSERVDRELTDEDAFDTDVSKRDRTEETGAERQPRRSNSHSNFKYDQKFSADFRESRFLDCIPEEE